MCLSIRDRAVEVGWTPTFDPLLQLPGIVGNSSSSLTEPRGPCLSSEGFQRRAIKRETSSSPVVEGWAEESWSWPGGNPSWHEQLPLLSLELRQQCTRAETPSRHYSPASPISPASVLPQVLLEGGLGRHGANVKPVVYIDLA